jgi:hypothetical protein
VLKTARGLDVGDLVRVGHWSPEAGRAALVGKLGLIERITPLMVTAGRSMSVITIIIEGKRHSFFDHELLEA